MQERKEEYHLDNQDVSDVSHLEVTESGPEERPGAHNESNTRIEDTNAEEAKKVLRKIDWHLLPVLMLVNAIQLIDKNACLLLDFTCNIC